jgi:hypothetical protein
METSLTEFYCVICDVDDYPGTKRLYFRDCGTWGSDPMKGEDYKTIDQARARATEAKNKFTQLDIKILHCIEETKFEYLEI